MQQHPDDASAEACMISSVWEARKISVEDAEETRMQRKRVQESRRKGAETLKRCRLAEASQQA